MLSVTTTQRLRKRRVGSPAQLGLQSLLVASPLSAAVSLAVPFLFRHASTNHHGRIWPCVIRRPTRAGGHAIGDVFVTKIHLASVPCVISPFFNRESPSIKTPPLGRWNGSLQLYTFQLNGLPSCSIQSTE